jgi:5-methylcytosine-specific restriction protein A
MLLPAEEGLYPDDVVNGTLYEEGAVGQVTVNAYERNAKARQRCIEHYGAKCAVCGFVFEERYGVLGSGFIHVHHLRLLASAGGSHAVDPIYDLRPVCPNCHAMLHQKNPPLSIEELRAHLLSVRT